MCDLLYHFLHLWPCYFLFMLSCCLFSGLTLPWHSIVWLSQALLRSRANPAITLILHPIYTPFAHQAFIRNSVTLILVSLFALTKLPHLVKFYLGVEPLRLSHHCPILTRPPIAHQAFMGLLRIPSAYINSCTDVYRCLSFLYRWVVCSIINHITLVRPPHPYKTMTNEMDEKRGNHTFIEDSQNEAGGEPNK